MQCVNFEDSELFTKRERVEFGTTEHKPSRGRDRRICTTVHYWLPSYFACYRERKATKTKIITSYKNPSFMTPLFWYPESWGAASPVVSKACLIYNNNNNNALHYQIRKLLITIKDNRNRKLGKFILNNLKAKPNWVMLNSVYIKKVVSDKTWN